jgi:hypothetical protein
MHDLYPQYVLGLRMTRSKQSAIRSAGAEVALSSVVMSLIPFRATGADPSTVLNAALE